MLLHIYTVKNRDAATVYDSFTELDLTYYTYKDDQAGQGTWQVWPEFLFEILTIAIEQRNCLLFIIIAR